MKIPQKIVATMMFCIAGVAGLFVGNNIRNDVTIDHTRAYYQLPVIKETTPSIFRAVGTLMSTTTSSSTTQFRVQEDEHGTSYQLNVPHDTALFEDRLTAPGAHGLSKRITDQVAIDTFKLGDMLYIIYRIDENGELFANEIYRIIE